MIVGLTAIAGTGGSTIVAAAAAPANPLATTLGSLVGTGGKPYLAPKLTRRRRRRLRGSGTMTANAIPIVGV